MKFLVLLANLLPFVVRAWAPQHVVSRPSLAPTTSKKTSVFMSDDGAEGVSSGTVKWFDTVKGYGFIVPDDGSSDIFVHQTAIQTEGFRSLAEGESVEYAIETDNSGRRKATMVTGPDGADVQGQPFQPQNDFDSY